MNSIKKLEIQGAAVFNLTDYEFYEKLGEGNTFKGYNEYRCLRKGQTCSEESLKVNDSP